MATLTIQSIAESLDSVHSWNTRVSRTRVSTVDGFACTESSDAAVQSLEGVLRMVKRLKLKQCQFSDIEEVQGRIGEGETFVVDKCKLSDKIVAVKHIKLGDINVDQRAFHRRLQSVVREISIMNHQPLAQHPHILQLLGYGWKLEGSSPLPYIVVEYGVGGDLRSYLQEQKHSTLKAKIIHCGDVACGLMALHQCGIVHGDLKLNNVIIFESWDRPSGTIAKLCDFGHSLLLAVENPSSLRYVGTTLYNAPEVSKQKQTPIEWENLHKCDIWAYGLLVWEILADGEIYFKRKWRHDPNFARSTREITSGTTTSGDMRSPTTGEATQEESIQPEEEGVMGRFDSKHLRNLATQFVNTMKFPIFEKGCLGPLFRLTLQEDPSMRMSDLNRLPIVSVWNSSGASSLQHKLAMHVGTSEFTFEMFQGRDIPWEYQVSMLSDFERVANLRQGGEQATAAAFHVALCYVLGFGTKVDYSTATQYLRKAEEQAHPMAQLFGPRLLSRISNLPTSGLLDYTHTIDKAFRLKRYLSKSTKIVLTVVTAKTTDKDLKGLELDTDASQPHSFASFDEFRDWVLAFIQFKGDLVKWQVTVGSAPKMNLLECAIAFDDSDLVWELLNIKHSVIDWDNVGAWNETPLIQATRRGNAKAVSLLLNAKHNPSKCAQSGSSVYHWLFCLTIDNEEAVVQSLFATLFLDPMAPQAIEQLCTLTYPLHSQWPLVFTGSPLAFAVMSGSLSTVEALLQHGANPRWPAFGPHEDGKPSSWTSLHLATKYHFAEILTVLVQQAGEMVRNSADPLKELGVKLDRSRNSLHRTSLRSGDIPEALLAEALLQYDDLQLPCVLSNVTMVERYGIHGAYYRQVIRDILDIMPLKSVEWRSSNGQTGLMQAIDDNDYDLASVLLDRSPSLASKAFKDPTESGSHTWPFHFACQVASRRDSEETTDIAAQILQLHPRAITDKDSRFRTALHMGVTGFSSRVTSFLLLNGAEVDAVDIEGASALHYVRSLSNAVTLMDKGANINYTNRLGLAPIHIATSIGADEIVAELVKRGANLDLHNNEIGSPLQCAVMKRSKASVYSLVQGGAQINIRDRENNTAAILAARSGRVDIMQILLDAGADVSARNSLYLTPLRAAILGKSSGMVEKILTYDVSHIAREKSSQSVFHLAADVTDTLTMQALLDIIPPHILSVNALNGTNQTPLHVAAMAARNDIAEIILEQDAQVDLKDADGSTPLLTACRAGKKRMMDFGGNRTEFVDLLVRHGAQIATQDKKGQNPWSLARAYQDFNLMSYILEHVQFTEQLPHLLHKDPPDRELLEWAVLEEEWDFVTTCLRSGAIHPDFLPPNLVAETAANKDKLFAYARRGDKTMVQWIFEASKKESLRNQQMHTGVKYTGMRNLFLEFNETGAAFDPDASKPSDPLSDAPPSPLPADTDKKTSSSRISSFLSNLRDKNKSSKPPPVQPPSPGPQPQVIAPPSTPGAELFLSPTTTNESSSQSPSRGRTASFGSFLSPP